MCKRGCLAVGHFISLQKFEFSIFLARHSEKVRTSLANLVTHPPGLDLSVVAQVCLVLGADVQTDRRTQCVKLMIN